MTPKSWTFHSMFALHLTVISSVKRYSDKKRVVLRINISRRPCSTITIQYVCSFSFIIEFIQELPLCIMNLCDTEG